MTKFFLACSCPPCLQESAHQTQSDEFLLADENIAHTHADDHGATKGSRRKHSTTQVPPTSAGSGTVRDEPIPASMPTTSELPPRPVRKCSGSMSLESDVPPKRLKLGPLKGWESREMASVHDRSNLLLWSNKGVNKLTVRSLIWHGAGFYRQLAVMDKIEIWARKSQVKALITRGAASKWPTERVRQPRQLNAVMWLSSSDDLAREYHQPHELKRSN
ncbi:hypothetical protein C8J57DRAFT_1240816 [Mycena rebaudengoi]|nr:hypothetical protein C8J57DRAFT_1240816 [Mycena rebaudengoi]